MSQKTLQVSQIRSYCPIYSKTGERYELDTTNARVGMVARNDWSSQLNYTENEAALKWRYFRSLVWFDIGTLVTDIGQGTVNSVSIGYTSNDYGADGAVNVRTYRTNLAFDSSQEFGQTVGYFWTQGITHSVATNDYLLDYSEIQMGKNAAETAVLCYGDEAKELVNAIVAGYAVGFYLPYPEATQYTGSYGLRSFTNITLTVEWTPKDDKACPPTESVLLRCTVTKGQQDIPLYFAGASTGDTTGNYIIGYFTRYADSSDGGSTFGTWSAPFAHNVEQGATTGTLHVSAPAEVGIRRKFQIATVGKKTTSAYADVSGYLLSVEPPTIGTIEKNLRYCVLNLTVTLPASPNGEFMTLSMTADGENETDVRTVPPAGGAVHIRRLLSPAAATTVTVTVSDAYGVDGDSQTFTLSPVSRAVGANYVAFGGISSADLGLIVSGYVNPDAAPLRVENQTVIGRSGDVALTEGDGVADAYDLTTTLYLDDLSLLPFIREWLSGEGWATFGIEPEYRLKARVDAGLPFERLTQGATGYELPVTFHCQPYKYRAAEEEIEFLHNGSICNSGDTVELPLISFDCTGDGSITVNGSTITVEGLNGAGVIDCNALTVTKNGELFTAWSGDFPQFKRGSNEVSFSGQVSRLVFTRRERFR